MKLQKKFILIFVLITVIPISFLSVFTFSRYTGLVDRQTNQTASHLLNVAASQVNYTLLQLDQIVETMYLTQQDSLSVIDDIKKYSGTASFTDNDIYQSNEKLKYICQNFVYSNSAINGVFLFTASGITLGYGYGNGSSIRTNYFPAAEEWYQETLQLAGSTYVYGPSVKDFITSQTESISFCTALYDVYNKTFLGVLFIDCNPSIFDLGNFNSLPDIASLTVKNQDASLYQTGISPKEDALTLTQELNLSCLSLELKVNHRELLSEFHVTQIILLALSVTCIVGILILSLFLSESIIHPIVHLSHQMQKRDGNQSVTNSHYFHYEDEIGTLYNSYQEMLDERNYYIKHELENKLIVLDSQMRALETQINAHFLYNTLEAINSIAIREKVPEISTMALSLGNMFRYSIKTNSELVTLENELKNVQDYVNIQLLRHSHAFSVKFLVPDELLSKKVLKLILQPLVENSVTHGLNSCLQGGIITVTAELNDSFLFLTVEDNGCGIPPETLILLNQELKQKAAFTNLGKRKNSSIGLSNINTRISLYYGEQYGLQLFSQVQNGTRILLRLPVID